MTVAAHRRQSCRRASLLPAFGLLALSIPSWSAAPPTASPELDGREVMERNDAQRRTDDERMELTMRLINARGKERTRELVRITATGDHGLEKSLLRFLAPADVEGTALLTIEQADRDDDRWLYLPALRRVRRISARDRSDAFMGSDFAYEDLDTEQLDRQQYRLRGVEPCAEGEEGDDAECWLVEARPLDQEASRETGYSRRLLRVRRDNAVVVRVQYFDHHGELLKVFEAREIEPVGDTGIFRARQMTMANVQTGHRTVIELDRIRMNEGVDAELFTRRYLERER